MWKLLRFFRRMSETSVSATNATMAAATSFKATTLSSACRNKPKAIPAILPAARNPRILFFDTAAQHRHEYDRDQQIMQRTDLERFSAVQCD
ncbi:hypothetical protein QW131_31650 [Roseibium salinum]|nr:hypothetical protein [Roseibium salinum]